MGGPGPDAQEIERLLTLAARTPDHGKLAPWRFILFEGEARARAGAIFEQAFAQRHPQASAEQLDIERKRFLHAPLVVGVISAAAPHAKIPEWEQALSAGAVCMNLTIAANAMGFVSAWLTQWISYDAQVLAALGVKPGEKVAGFVHVGRAQAAPQDRPRPALSDLVTRF
jgi:nitroreductase